MMVYVSGTGGYRVQLVVPKDTQQVVDNMRRGTLDADTRKYMTAVLDRIGSSAVIKARSILNLGTAGGLEEVTEFTAAIRGMGANDRPSLFPNRKDRPLVDTGKMRDGIRGIVDKAALTVTLGVVGDRAEVARMHENGYSFKVSPQDKSGKSTVGHFTYFGPTRAMAWAMKNAGQVISVPARPFIAPALEDARSDVLLNKDPRFNLARDLFQIWIGGQYGPVSASSRFGAAPGYSATMEPAKFIKDAAARGGVDDA